MKYFCDNNKIMLKLKKACKYFNYLAKNTNNNFSESIKKVYSYHVQLIGRNLLLPPIYALIIHLLAIKLVVLCCFCMCGKNLIQPQCCYLMETYDEIHS